MTTAEDQQQHQGYSDHEQHPHYEQQAQEHNNLRPIFSHTESTDSIHSNTSYHSQEHQQYTLTHPTLLPQQQQQQYNKSESSPHRMNSMSSQPTTPKPSSATITTSPTLEQQQETDNTTTTPTTTGGTSTPLPLEQPQQQKYVTPVGTSTTTESYSPHTNTIRTTSHRKDSIAPNLNETCPSFGPTEYNHNIISMDRHSIIDVRLHTKVDRGFFLAEEDWTCYRRNYFQVSGSFSLEGIGILYEGQEFPCLAKDSHTGQLEEIHCFLLGVSARLSDCEKSIQLIQHTPKRDKGPQTTPTPKPIRPGGNIGFSAVGSSQSIVTFERLQFKTATANNGKRRAAQQYYVIIVELLAKLRNGNTVQVASTKSSALVVRGRSPGHYAETDSGTPHTVTPRQHRASAANTSNANVASSAANAASNVMHHPPPPQAQHHHHHQVPSPYNGGRPTAYAGASPNLFQPTEYMSYDYHGVGYANYGHMPPPPPPPPQQHPQQQQQYPNNTSSGHSSPVPIMAHHHHQQQHHYMNDAARPSPSPSSSEYPNHHHYEQQHHDVKEEQHNSSPYYWQRNTNNGGHEEQQQHHEDQQQQQQQEHWNRMRMASNNSTSTDHSHGGSPYMNHPHQEQHGYYAQQQPHHPYGAPHPSAYGHPHPPHQGLPPPPTNGTSDHYQTGGYNNYAPTAAGDWQQQQRKTVYSYESDARGGGTRQQQQQQQDYERPPISSPEQQKQTTVVK